MRPAFAQPEWILYGLIVLIGMTLLMIWSDRKAQLRLRQFAASSLVQSLTASRSPFRIWFKRSLLLLSTLLLFGTLARPQWGATWEETEAVGIDLMFALDTSRSMLAEDIAPNRLERSRLAILDFLNKIQGDRVGLIAFAGKAFLQCPLTLDYQAFRNTLAAIDTRTIPSGGTDIAAAIDEAEAYFSESENARILILLTDGEDLEASGILRARQAAGNGLRIYTVGVGSPEGELIPVTTPDGQTDFLRDASGKPVTSALDEANLSRIALAANGQYAPLGPTGIGLTQIYEHMLTQFPGSDRAETLQRIPIERFQWPLLAAILLLALEPLLGSRQRPSKTGIALCFSVIFLGLATRTEASAYKGASLLKAGQYEEAVEVLEAAAEKSPDNPKIQYNLGIAAYRFGEPELAIRSFQNALSGAKPTLQADSFFNSGNVRVDFGAELLQIQPAQARSQWEAALRDYRNALSIEPEAADVQQNLEALETLIESHTYPVEIDSAPMEGGSVEAPESAFHRLPVPVEAKPEEGWRFRQWIPKNADTVEIEDPQGATTTLAFSDFTPVTADFVKTWDLSVAVNDPSMGTAEKSGTYDADTPVPVKAEGKDYFAFSRWSALPADHVTLTDEAKAETEVTLTGNATLTAHFVPAFKLTAVPDPIIGGQVGPSGFFEEYSSVPIQAQPRPGFEWRGWQGSGIEDPTAQQTRITLTEDRSITARMERVWNLVIVPVPEEGGQPAGAGNHPVGSTVEITAAPAEGFTFSHWEGPGVADSKSASTTVTVASTEHTLFAHYTSEDSNSDQNQDSSDDNSQDQEQSQDNPDSQNSEQSEQSEQPEEPQDNSELNSEEESPSDSGEQPEAQEPAQPVPGQMSREAARQLLNALAESEKVLPAGERSREEEVDESAKGRDW